MHSVLVHLPSFPHCTIWSHLCSCTGAPATRSHTGSSSGHHVTGHQVPQTGSYVVSYPPCITLFFSPPLPPSFFTSFPSPPLLSSRLFTAMCRLQGEPERVLFLCFDLVRKPLRANEIPVIPGITSIWPGALSRKKEVKLFERGKQILPRGEI